METNRDIEEAREVHRALSDIFRVHPGGWADHETLRKVERLCFRARQAIAEHYCREKIGTVEEYADILFSSRKHERWARGSVTGSEFVKLAILKALNSFEKGLCTLEAARLAGGIDDPDRGQKRGV